MLFFFFFLFKEVLLLIFIFALLVFVAVQAFLELCRVEATLVAVMWAPRYDAISCCGAWALRHAGVSSCSSRALECRLNKCGTQAWVLRGMWDLPGSGNLCLLHWHVNSLLLSHKGSL